MIRRLAMLAVIPALGVTGIATAGIATAGAAHAAPAPSPVQQNLQRAAALIHPAATTTAGGDCNLMVASTARVVSETRAIPVQMTGSCAASAGSKALWYVGSSLNTSRDGVIFDGATHSDWNLYADTPLGTRTWHGWAAVDVTGKIAYQQNAPQTTVKVGSWAGLQANRSGGTVTIDTRAVRYATSLNRNIALTGTTGVIQYRAPGTTTWTNLVRFTTDSGGAAHYTDKTSAARQYRAVYAEGTYVWGATSPTASAPAGATSTVAILKSGDTFSTAQKGVVCQAEAAGLVCMFHSALPYNVSAAAAKRICGNAALEGVVLGARSWRWDCATDVQVSPTAATNAWAARYKFPIDPGVNAPIVPANWSLNVDGIPCHVSSNGVLGCAATKVENTGFVADSHYVYPRGVNTN